MLLAVAAVLAASLAAAMTPGPRRTADACSFGPPVMEQLLHADVIALVEITSVQGAINAQPTLTPTATATLAAPPTPTPFVRIASPTPEEAIPTRAPVDLRGVGATANVVRLYRGDASSPLTIDAAAREELERAARGYEAMPPDIMPPCPVGLGYERYATGHQYVIFARGGGSSVETEFYGAWEVLEGERGVPYVPGPGNLMVTRQMYDAYLRGLEASPDESFMYVRARRIPFEAFERMITGGPAARPEIALPDTGSAGLKRGGGR